MPAIPAPSRRGTLLVVVLGLITIFLALMLAITVRVYNSTKSGTALQQNVQAYIMMEGAKLLVRGNDGVVPSAISAGDQTDLATKGKPYGDMLGWFHIKAVTPATTPPSFDIIAAGGSSAYQTPKVAITDGTAERNAYEIRYHYLLSYDKTMPVSAVPTVLPAAQTTKFSIQLQTAASVYAYQSLYW